MPEDQPNTDQSPRREPGAETQKPDPAMMETIAPDSSDTNGDLEYSDDVIVSPLGRYEIKKLLGRGGMGSVYLAHDSQLDRDVALKVPKFDGNANPKQIERFYREARSAANLSHPNLCQVFDVGETDDKHYIAMAYIKGRPLSDYVRDGKQPATRVAAGIIRKVALAMHEAHDSGIIHRDLKPANIMIDHRNEPIVMDFGLAVAHENDTESRLTQDGALLGSPAYMPPEQLQGDLEALGPRSDVYALGVVLYELLTGKLPFDGAGSTIAMIGQILSKPPVPLAEARPDIEPSLIQICEKAMSKDPSDRYSTMKTFAADLTAFIKSSPGETSKVAPSKSTTNATPTSGQKTKQVTLAEVQLSEKGKLAKMLCDTGEYSAAIPVLKQILATPGAESTKVYAFAKATLPKAEEAISRQKPQAAAPQVSKPVDDPFASLPDAAPAPAGTPAYMQPSPHRKKNTTKSKPLPMQPILIGGGLVVGLLFAGLGFLMIQGNAADEESNVAESTTAEVPVLQSAQQNVAASQRTMANSTADSDSMARKGLEEPKEARGFREDRGFDRPGPPGGKRIGERFRSRVQQHIADFDKDNDGELLLSDIPFPLKGVLKNGDINDDGILDSRELELMKQNERERMESMREGFDEFRAGPGPGRGGPGRRERDGPGPGQRRPRDF